MDTKPEEVQQDTIQSSAPTPQPSSDSVGANQMPPASPSPVQTTTPNTNMPNTVVTSSSHGKSKTLYMIIGIIVILLVAGGAAYYFMMKQKAPLQPMAIQHTMQTQTPQAMKETPVAKPVTAANVDQTLNNTDSTMQQAVNQANTDLNSVSNINSSQDSSSNL